MLDTAIIYKRNKKTLFPGGEIPQYLHIFGIFPFHLFADLFGISAVIADIGRIQRGVVVVQLGTAAENVQREKYLCALC